MALALDHAPMTYSDLAAEVRDDFWAAEESRRHLEERKKYDYGLYRRFREDVENFGFAEAISGPFGWSKLTVPLIYWITETILPRLAVNPPTPVVKATSAAGVPYAQAKELRLQDTVDRMEMSDELVVALKQMIIYGDGPTKLTWNSTSGLPRFTSISWFDFFMSAEARTYEEADVLYHRSWYTRRQLQRLSRQVDRNGNPLWHNLDKVWESSSSVDVSDETYNERREMSGYGPQTFGQTGGPVPLVECWYQDGTVVVLGGYGFETVVQVRVSPFRDADGHPIRPFVLFSNTPDLDLPYSIGDAEMLEDHQVELSTLRNQAIDATTININSPVVYQGGIDADLIDAAFGQPGGKLAVSGDVRAAALRLSPGNVTADFYNFYENIRSESQFVSGVNDNIAGQQAVSEQTATEIRVINEEANKRWQLKVAGVERRMTKALRMIDAAEARFGLPFVDVPLPRGFRLRPGQQGVYSADGRELADSAGTGVLGIGTPPSGARFRVSVRAGSLTMPSEDREAQKLLRMLEVVGQVEQLAVEMDWREVAKLVVAAMGYDPEELLIDETERMMQQLVAGAPPGATPVGPPEPVPQNGAAPGAPVPA